MVIAAHTDTFAGLPIAQAGDDDGFFLDEDALASPEQHAWRLSMADFEASPDDFAAALTQLLDTVGADRIRALVIGDWGGASIENRAPVELLAGVAQRLGALEHLFLGEMTVEESEISWIKQSDVTPLLRAYPRLRTLRVRGGDGLELEPVRHDALTELAFESGGLPAAVVRAVGASEFPALTRLELWLGVDAYGGEARAADLAGVLAGAGLPRVQYLGLRDAEIADEVAAALASAPVVGRLDDLDLSMGALSDTGALALLGGQPLTHLRALNLAHHFLSEAMAAAVVERLPGVEVDVSDRQVADDWGRYVAVSE